MLIHDLSPVQLRQYLQGQFYRYLYNKAFQFDQGKATKVMHRMHDLRPQPF